ncbi:MAG: ATP-binding protein [Longimicrobiales bacterium]|nr:ATP-binding protein [Longimicrobiales bacterium]
MNLLGAGPGPRVEALHIRALRATPTPLLLHAEDGEVLAASHAWTEITGYPPEDFPSMEAWTALAYGEEAPRVMAGIRRLYDLQAPVHEGEFRIRTHSGEVRVWDFHSNPVGRLPDGRRVVVSVAHDVTDRVRAQREVRRLSDTLEDQVQERTQEVRDAYRELEAFSHSIAHDLRAPLRAVNGYAEILLRDHAAWLDSRGEELVRSIARAALDMGALMDDLLRLSGTVQEAPTFGPVDMDATAEAALERVRTAHPGYGGRVVKGPLPDAWGSAPLLQQVLVNLLDNAVKYSAPVPEPRIEITAHTGPRGPEYRVRDNGVGFDAALAPRMFDIFGRLHGDDFPGSGIGLAIVERIVRRHGGEIHADGTPGAGACVTFRLPHPRSPMP